MGKRYYCDYCDKTFPYNTVNRKKHNEGSQHQMLKNNYYAQFKGISTRLITSGGGLISTLIYKRLEDSNRRGAAEKAML